MEKRCDEETTVDVRALSMDGSQHSSLGDDDDEEDDSGPDSGGGVPEPLSHHASPVGSDASSGSHSKKVRTCVYVCLACLLCVGVYAQG
jgi:hypothetical protein